MIVVAVDAFALFSLDHSKIKSIKNHYIEVTNGYPVVYVIRIDLDNFSKSDQEHILSDKPLITKRIKEYRVINEIYPRNILYRFDYINGIEKFEKYNNTHFLSNIYNVSV